MRWPSLRRWARPQSHTSTLVSDSTTAHGSERSLNPPTCYSVRTVSSPRQLRGAGYPDLKPLLDVYLAEVRERLGADVSAVALYGSVARGQAHAASDIDLFVVRGNVGPNLLYRKRGDNTFEDVAAGAGARESHWLRTASVSAPQAGARSATSIG